MAVHRYILVGCLLAFTLGSASGGLAQVGTGTGYVPGQSYWGATDPGAVRITEGFRLIPSVMVGERYDSNVLLVPKTQGVDRYDFVTTVAPQIRSLYEGRSVSVNMTAGGVGEYYAENTNLNYFGADVNLLADFSKFLEQWRAGSKWQVGESYRYSPQMQSFITGNINAPGSDAFVRGYQAGRVNAQTNNLFTNVSVPLNKTLSVNASYSYGFIQFGESQVQQGLLLDTTTHAYTAGMEVKVTPVDTFLPKFIGSQFDYASAGSFATRGGTLGWKHAFSPIIEISADAGAQYVDSPVGALTPTGSLTATWRGDTTNIGFNYFATVTPTYQFQAQPLLTQTWSIALTHVTSITDLVGTLGGNFGKGNEIKGGSALPFSYWSYGVNAGLTYKVTPKTFLAMNFLYSDFKNTFGGDKYSIDRSVVQVTLTQAIY